MRQRCALRTPFLTERETARRRAPGIFVSFMYESYLKSHKEPQPFTGYSPFASLLAEIIVDLCNKPVGIGTVNHAGGFYRLAP